jgi:hypothetical protein
MASDHKVDAFGIHKMVNNQYLLHMNIQSNAVLICIHRHTSKMMINIPMSCLALTWNGVIGINNILNHTQTLTICV